jgi:ribose transport system substrate-binding protein
MLKKISSYVLAPLLFLISGQAQNLEVLGEYKIGIVGQDQEDTIYQAAHLGAQEASREMSRRYSIDVELIVLTPDSSQGGDQQTSLGQLFIEAADGFLISPDRSVLDAVRFAQQQGQEIVFFETELKAIEPLASIVADEYTAGTLAGQNMLQRLPTKGRTAILMAKDPSPAMQQRLQGVRACDGV